MRKLTQQQRGFCLDVIKEIPAGQAYMNHYKVKSRAVADMCASRMIRTDKIKAHLQDIRKKMEDDSIAGPIERRQILTEIARARMTDFMTCSADGVWMHDIGPENMNRAGLKKIETTTMPFGKDDDDLKILLTKVELTDPTRAIDLLNKMDKLYSDGATVNINNTKVEAKVAVFDTKDVAGAIIEAIRLGLNPAILGGNGHGEDAAILSSPTDIQTTTVPESEN